MKKAIYYVEFGERGGFHSSNIRMLNKTDAAKLCASLVITFTQDNQNHSTHWRNWYLAKNSPRQTWTSSTHFVALSKLDERNEGPATPNLWRKDK
jgi:hypothetical protein